MGQNVAFFQQLPSKVGLLFTTNRFDSRNHEQYISNIVHVSVYCGGNIIGQSRICASLLKRGYIEFK